MKFAQSLVEWKLVQALCRVALYLCVLLFFEWVRLDMHLFQEMSTRTFWRGLAVSKGGT